MNKVHESLRFFSEMSALYRQSVDPLWSQYPDHDRDPWDALGVLLEGYAFERQGRKPDYSHVAADVIKKMKRRGIPVRDANSPMLVWREFCCMLDSKDLNEKVNPLCPEGTEYKVTYKSKGTIQTKPTSKPSIIEVAATLAPTSITAFARQCLTDDRAADVEQRLTQINGMGTKIVCLFLRDMTSHFRISVSARSAVHLQPIDVHVRRISKRIKGDRDANDAKIARWIVKESEEAGVLAADVNVGMWHFGSQIAMSEYRTYQAIDDLSYARELVDVYIRRLSQVVQNWKGRG